MAKKIKRKAKKPKASKKGGKIHGEEAVAAINRIVKSLRGIADIVEVRPNVHRIYCKGEAPETKGSTMGRARESLIGEIRPHRGKVNIGFNKEADKGLVKFKKYTTNFTTLTSYEVEESDNIKGAVKKVASKLSDLYDE